MRHSWQCFAAAGKVAWIENVGFDTSQQYVDLVVNRETRCRSEV
jgi:hypothetical protein